MPPARRSLTVMLALLAATAPAHGQDGFEGTITYKLRAGGMDATLRYMMRGTKVRQEIESGMMPGQAVMLMDTEGETIRVIMPGMGMYMEMDMKQMMAAAEAQGMTPTTAPKLTKLGTSDEVAGIKCDNYRFESTETFEACVATGMGWFINAPSGRGRANAMSGPNFAAYREQFRNGMLPLRMTRTTAGARDVIMEATGIDRKPVDPKMFDLPPGLQKMDMPGMRPPGR